MNRKPKIENVWFQMYLSFYLNLYVLIKGVFLHASCYYIAVEQPRDKNNLRNKFQPQKHPGMAAEQLGNFLRRRHLQILSVG